ncbi:radical SAM protein [Verrucomicrobia bacterium]|nr:radical SAM protein [Verrucomicrobiota bacterium]
MVTKDNNFNLIADKSESTAKSIRVLFIYPNTYGMNMFPPAICMFTALLKREGHTVDLFDATYYSTDYGNDSDGSKADHLNVVPYDENERGIRRKQTHWRDDIREKVNSFQPDLLCVSSTEDMWELGMMLLEGIEDYIEKHKIPVLAGGVFCTFAPEIAIQHRLVDVVCVGEGEKALLQMCRRVADGLPFDDVTNCWVKTKDSRLVKNPITAPVNINESPMLDISLFEEERLYRPMAGKWYKMIPIETMRGCPFKCAYCNSPNQMELYEKETGGGYLRKKSTELIYKELKYFKEQINAEYIYFWADTFLATSNSEFEEFCDMYQEIGLPFWMQTRPETLSDHKISRLAKVGLHRISFGVEHGNDKFRKKYLQRNFRNEGIIDKLKIPHRHGVSFSVNNITGFPKETRELAMDTVELNRQIEADNANLYAFVPFHGTPLRKLTEEMGLIRPNTISKCLTDKPMLDQSQYSADEVAGLQKCFVLYTKFPKSRWPDIRRAEADTEEGNQIFEELRAEYCDKYLPASAGASKSPGIDNFGPDLNGASNSKQDDGLD